MTILRNIAWRFDHTDYPAREAFSAEVARYQFDILKERAVWHPNEVVIDSPAVDLVYKYWVTGNDAVFADEELHNPVDEDEEISVTATFTADNGDSFTALELLHKLHQRLRHRDLGDHYFFEGLVASEAAEPQQPPLFYLRCGS